MNNRHAFHAGNFADVLMMLVEHLKKWSVLLLLLNTRVGSLLDLRSASLPPEVAACVQMVREVDPFFFFLAALRCFPISLVFHSRPA